MDCSDNIYSTNFTPSKDISEDSYINAAGQLIDQGFVRSKDKPTELYVEPKTIATKVNPNTTALKRGQYRLTLTTSEDIPNAFQVLDKQVSVPIENQLKRLQFHKIDYVPVKGGTQITAIVSVMDNQFIIGGIVLGVATIGSLIAGSIFVDKVDEFSKDTTGKIVEIGGIVLAALGLYLTFFKKKK